MKKKSKGGKRTGAGRPKIEPMETISIRVPASSVEKWGGRSELRRKLYDFVAFPLPLQEVVFFNKEGGLIETRPLKSRESIQATVALKPHQELKIQSNPEGGIKVGDGSNEAILKQIEAIRAEKIPDLRNKSDIGRKSWKMEQQKRIEELQKQLK